MCIVLYSLISVAQSAAIFSVQSTFYFLLRFGFLVFQSSMLDEARRLRWIENLVLLVVEVRGVGRELYLKGFLLLLLCYKFIGLNFLSMILKIIE
jgi:hypothetical protein